MTTFTHSHTAWTNKGGHVSAVFLGQPLLDAMLSLSPAMVFGIAAILGGLAADRNLRRGLPLQAASTSSDLLKGQA